MDHYPGRPSDRLPSYVGEARIVERADQLKPDARANRELDSSRGLALWIVREPPEALLGPVIHGSSRLSRNVPLARTRNSIATERPQRSRCAGARRGAALVAAVVTTGVAIS